jgi:hypothetical protein
MDKSAIKTAIPPVSPLRNSSFLLIKTSLTRPNMTAAAIRPSPTKNRKKANLYTPIYEHIFTRQPATQKNPLARAIKAAPLVICSCLDIEIYTFKKKSHRKLQWLFIQFQKIIFN